MAMISFHLVESMDEMDSFIKYIFNSGLITT